MKSIFEGFQYPDQRTETKAVTEKDTNLYVIGNFSADFQPVDDTKVSFTICWTQFETDFTQGYLHATTPNKVVAMSGQEAVDFLDTPANSATETLSSHLRRACEIAAKNAGAMPQEVVDSVQPGQDAIQRLADGGHKTG